MHILHSVLYTSSKVVINPEFFKLVIIFFILVTLLYDSGVIV